MFHKLEREKAIFLAGCIENVAEKLKYNFDDSLNNCSIALAGLNFDKESIHKCAHTSEAKKLLHEAGKVTRTLANDK